MEKSVYRGVDRISGLPNSLLLHILSFLSAKEAVATSLLSKTWRPLWLSLDTLHFDRTNFQRLPSFHRFVDKVLESVDLKSVKRFVLRWDYLEPAKHFKPHKISEWIDAVTSNKVEHLELHLDTQEVEDENELRSNIFTANNVRVLKLSGVTVATLWHVNLPLLEVLHLEDVEFEDLRSLEMILSSCPLLKHLLLRILGPVDYHPLNIGRLNHLVTAEVPQSLIPLPVLSNATILRLYEDIWPLTVDTPMFDNLTHLESVVYEWPTMPICPRNFPKLQKLVLYKFGSLSLAEPILDVPLRVSWHLKEFTPLCFRRSEK